MKIGRLITAGLLLMQAGISWASRDTNTAFVNQINETIEHFQPQENGHASKSIQGVSSDMLIRFHAGLDMVLDGPYNFAYKENNFKTKTLVIGGAFADATEEKLVQIASDQHIPSNRRSYDAMIWAGNKLSINTRMGLDGDNHWVYTDATYTGTLNGNANIYLNSKKLCSVDLHVPVEGTISSEDISAGRRQSGFLTVGFASFNFVVMIHQKDGKAACNIVQTVTKPTVK